MRLTIHGRDIIIDETIKTLVMRRLRFALSRFADRIRRVKVVLSDHNGRKGGVDKECRVEIALLGNRTVVVQDFDSQVMSAISSAMSRAQATIGRQVERAKARKRYEMAS